MSHSRQHGNSGKPHNSLGHKLIMWEDGNVVLVIAVGIDCKLTKSIKQSQVYSSPS